MVPIKRNDPALPGGDRQVRARSHAHGIDMPKRNGPGIELLADPTRRRIIALLALCPRRPSSLAGQLGLSRPATTRQLNLLREADLVCSRRSTLDRRVVIYSVELRAQGPITAWLAGTEIGRPLSLRIGDDGVTRRE